jgi:hypothetical protein
MCSRWEDWGPPKGDELNWRYLGVLTTPDVLLQFNQGPVRIRKRGNSLPLFFLTKHQLLYYIFPFLLIS